MVTATINFAIATERFEVRRNITEEERGSKEALFPSCLTRQNGTRGYYVDCTPCMTFDSRDFTHGTEQPRVVSPFLFVLLARKWQSTGPSYMLVSP